MSLPTLLDSVRMLQTALQTKAKHEPATRFYSLWDKVCRVDSLTLIGGAVPIAAPQEWMRNVSSTSEEQGRDVGIPIIRDRVVQMAVLLVIGPIFEADLFPWQYGFRTGLDAIAGIFRTWNIDRSMATRNSTLCAPCLAISLLRSPMSYVWFQFLRTCAMGTSS